MTRIVTAIEIRAPIERVFDYATTAANWPSWHPASQSVRGATDHSAAQGERITEQIQTGGRSCALPGPCASARRRGAG